MSSHIAQFNLTWWQTDVAVNILVQPSTMHATTGPVTTAAEWCYFESACTTRVALWQCGCLNTLYRLREQQKTMLSSLWCAISPLLTAWLFLCLTSKATIWFLCYIWPHSYLNIIWPLCGYICRNLKVRMSRPTPSQLNWIPLGPSFWIHWLPIRSDFSQSFPLKHGPCHQ